MYCRKLNNSRMSGVGSQGVRGCIRSRVTGSHTVHWARSYSEPCGCFGAESQGVTQSVGSRVAGSHTVLYIGSGVARSPPVLYVGSGVAGSHAVRQE